MQLVSDISRSRLGEAILGGARPLPCRNKGSACAHEQPRKRETTDATMPSYTLSDVYALSIGSALILLLSYRLMSSLYKRLPRRLLGYLLRMTALPYLLRRHRYFGPVAVIDIVPWLLYLGANTFFAIYRVQSLDDAAYRLALLAETNMILLFLGSQLSFAADLVGLNIRRFSKIHLAAGCVVTVESAGHVLIYASRHSVSTQDRKLLFGIVVRADLTRG